MSDDVPAMRKPVAMIRILVYEDNSVHIDSDVRDQEQLRDIIHVAEEVVIRGALKKATDQQSKIIHAPAMPGLQKSN